MIEVDLIRHVKVSGSPALYGKTDVPPTQDENERLITRLLSLHNQSPFHRVICSPLIRCKQLGQTFASQCQLPLNILTDFQEMDFGNYDGIPFDSLARAGESMNRADIQDSSLSNRREQAHSLTRLSWCTLEKFFNEPSINHLPNAETLASFQQRVVKAWTLCIEEQIKLLHQASSHVKSASKTPQRIAIITHGGVIRIILAHILQLDWQNASLYQRLNIANGSLSRVRIHLPALINKNITQPSDKMAVELPNHRTLHQQVTTIATPLLEGPT